jgi:HEAT repeat protein
MTLPPTTELDTPETTGVPAETQAAVAELFSALDKSIRARRLYHATNPAYLGFLEALRGAVHRVWEVAATLHLVVEENGFRWGGQLHAVGEGRDSIAFLFYKDGIRYITLLPGFEEEAERFLDVLHQARAIDRQGDDIVTLLWEQEFASFQYGYVDVLTEGLQIPQGEPRTPEIHVQQITDDLSERPAGEVDEELEPWAAAPASTSASAAVRRDDFEETLYFLDETDLRTLREEVEKEWERDLKEDVLNALFDRLEDSAPPRQREIVGVLSQLLPTFLARGDLVSAAHILRDLDTILGRRVLGDELAAEAEKLFDQLSDAEILSQFIMTLEDGGIAPDAEELGLFFSHLRPQALPILVRAAETTSAEGLRARLRSATDRLAATNSGQVATMLGSVDDPAVVIGAARLAGRLRIAASAPRLARLLEQPDAVVRLAAVEALVALRSSAAVGALQQVLEDPDREVRVAAARGLGALRYSPARARFEQVLQGRAIRDADLTEKIAFFEAYGTLCGPEGVAVLEKVLLGKGFLGRRPPSDIRACAALGLGRIGSPASREVLEQAAQEQDAVVRSAVLRALRQEGAPR